MKIRITAISDVRFYCNVVSYKAERIGNSVGYRPINTLIWVNLRAGQSRDDISLVLGVDPQLLPSEPKLLVGTNLHVVPCEFNGHKEDKAQFYDLISMEVLEK